MRWLRAGDNVQSNKVRIHLFANPQKGLNKTQAEFTTEQPCGLQHRAECQELFELQMLQTNHTTEVKAKDWPTAWRSCDGRKSSVAQSCVS